MIVLRTDFPSDSAIEWLNINVGERLSYLPHYIGGKGWRYRRTTATDPNNIPKYKTVWELEIDNSEIATFYILKFS